MAIVRPLQVVERHRLAGDQRRTVLIAHARPRGQQGIAVGQVGEGVDADRRDLQLAAQGPLVERLDVLELVDEPQPAGVELVVGQGVEHECIVRIGAVADPDRRHGVVAHQAAPRGLGRARRSVRPGRGPGQSTADVGTSRLLRAALPDSAAKLIDRIFAERRKVGSLFARGRDRATASPARGDSGSSPPWTARFWPYSPMLRVAESPYASLHAPRVSLTMANNSLINSLTLELRPANQYAYLRGDGVTAREVNTRLRRESNASFAPQITSRVADAGRGQVVRNDR